MSEARQIQPAGYYKGDDELRSWLHNYLREHPHHTTIVLSRAAYIGISRKALDAYLAGTYYLPREEGGMGGSPSSSRLESSVRSFRARVERDRQSYLSGGFLETQTWKQLMQACATAILENRIVLIYGRAGIGKSRCPGRVRATRDGRAACCDPVLDVSFYKLFCHKVGRRTRLRQARSDRETRGRDSR